MNELSKHIERYIQGDLSPAEKHALERKALSDPFLNDALEGAESISTKEFTSDIRFLKGKVGKKTSSYIWPLRIAAGIILITATTILVIRLGDTIEPIAINTDSDVPGNYTSPSTIDELTKKQQPEEHDEGTTIMEEGRTTNFSQNSGSDNRINVNDSANEMSSSVPLREEESTENELNMTEEEVGFSKSRTQIGSLSQLRSAPTPSMGMAKKIESEERPIANIVASNPSASFLNDNPEVKTTDIVIYALPTGGMKPFNQYLAEHMRYPPTALINDIEGSVVIIFDLDKDSLLTNFEIKESLGYGCDEEALRLIKEGSSWIPGSINGMPIESQVELSIQFNIP